MRGLECIVNVSEGKDAERLDYFASTCTSSLLDLHSDPHHNRSVFTLFGPYLGEDLRSLATAVVESLDIREHSGIHPRIGVLDVVPFCPLGGSTMDEAIAARNEFARWIWTRLGVPAFLYGPERKLPEIRRGAFSLFGPDFGAGMPHASAGACAVGARNLLVAYNLVMDAGIDEVRQLANEIRSPQVRALAMQAGADVQLSMNLVAPLEVTPADVYDFAAARHPVIRAELVGLVPEEVMTLIKPERWEELGLSETSTIEARIAAKPWSQPV
ncbi:MAG: hypothetical protein M0000_09450 [Actinomycetota bacterium]|nr:hypothetical protein [Actinomycetota bacterium]MDA8209305.1 hypothetical protein [Actinomycetota bacterium]